LLGEREGEVLERMQTVDGSTEAGEMGVVGGDEEECFVGYDLGDPAVVVR
jgi:hypothetical protein